MNDHRPLSVGSYAELIAARMQAETTTLASRWLDRLAALLPNDVGDVFPGDLLLDHIPALVAEIGRYIVAPAAGEIAANTAVLDKARELGLLRHRQRASLHQLLREYDLLAEILASFVGEETSKLGIEPPAGECLAVVRRIDRAVRALMRVTVETFVAEFAETLTVQERRLESFRHMISHELRTPLGTLVFTTRLLRLEGMEPERRRRVIDTLERNIERLSTLVNDLQRLSGDSLAERLPTVQRVEMAEVARDVARRQREAAERRQVRIQVSDELPGVVVDTARLDLILTNLVSNAVKYSDPAKPERWVRIEPVTVREPGWWGLAVSDNGIGIPAAALPTIFDRFTRAHAERDPELDVEGNGLGLAIARESIEAVGGTVVCRSTVGEGTVIELRFPQL